MFYTFVVLVKITVICQTTSYHSNALAYTATGFSSRNLCKNLIPCWNRGQSNWNMFIPFISQLCFSLLSNKIYYKIVIKGKIVFRRKIFEYIILLCSHTIFRWVLIYFSHLSCFHTFLQSSCIVFTQSDSCNFALRTSD